MRRLGYEATGTTLHVYPGAQQGGGGRRPPLLFFENQKKCPNFKKKFPDCALPWVKFSIQNVV